MTNYQDSLQLQITSPLDAKACNYYKESIEFVIEPLAKYLERVPDVYRAVGSIVAVLEAKEGYTPTIGGDGLIRFSLASFPAELVNFDIKYYTFVDGLEDADFQQIDFEDAQTLTAGATSGIDVDGGDSSSASSIAITQNDSKLPESTPISTDSIGFSDGTTQSKTELGNLPGWDFTVNGSSEQEVKIGSSVGVAEGANITLTYDAGEVTIDAAATAVDLYMNGELVNAGTPIIDISQGDGINLEYNEVGQVVVTSTAALSNGLRSGGSVIHLTGYTYTVSLASYVIGGILYNTPATSITLATADPTNPRIDVIAINDQEEVVVLQGVPSSDPQQPTVDPATQIALTYVLLLANSSEPAGISNDLIYDENIEWTTGSAGVTVNFSSNIDPFSNSICASVGLIDNNNLIYFTKGTSLLSTDFESISLFLKLRESASNFHNLFVQFFNSGSPVSNEVALSFDRADDANWQPLILQLSAFSFSSSDFDTVQLRWSETKPLPSHLGFYLDLIRLQAGVEQVTISNSVKLIGDVTANGETGSPIQTTLATVNVNPGISGSESEIPIITTNGKGLVTNISTASLDLSVIDYDYVSTNDTTTDVTGAELEELSDASVTALHSHIVDPSQIQQNYSSGYLGYLYNWFTIDDPKELTSSSDWRVPTVNDFLLLVEAFTGTLYTTDDILDGEVYGDSPDSLRNVGATYWEDNESATNSLGLSLNGSGLRDPYGGDFTYIKEVTAFQSSDRVEGEVVIFAIINSAAEGFDFFIDFIDTEEEGDPIRLVKDATGLSDGTTTTYTGNDGKTYNAIVINELYWTTTSLVETKYRDGSWIPGYNAGVYTPIDDMTWTTLVTGALCAYNDDESGILNEGTYTGVIYTQEEKDKLEAIESGAEVNPTNLDDIPDGTSYVRVSATNHTDLTDSGDTTLHYHSTDRDRANHTGTQTLSTISDAGSIASLDYWTGTQAEYDALGTYDSNTLYFIEE